MQDVKLVNATKHDIVLHTPEGDVILPPSGLVARVWEEMEEDEMVQYDGHQVPIYRRRFGQLVGLPDPQPNVYYIVSTIVLEHSDRPDLLAPNTLRDRSGQVTACKGFVRRA